jgi:hypothetical protein
VLNLGTPTGGTPPTTAGNLNISGGIFVNGVPFSAGLAEPTGTAGEVFGREIGTPNAWTGVLPLAGGVLADLDNSGEAFGLSLTVDATAPHSGVRITNQSGTHDGLELTVAATSQGGMSISNLSTTASAYGLHAFNMSAVGVGIIVTNNAAGTGLDINNTGGGVGMLVRNTAVNHLQLLGNGVLNIGTPTGGTPPTTPGNVNVSGGYFVNGVSIDESAIDGGTF